MATAQFNLHEVSTASSSNHSANSQHAVLQRQNFRNATSSSIPSIDNQVSYRSHNQSDEDILAEEFSSAYPMGHPGFFTRLFLRRPSRKDVKALIRTIKRFSLSEEDFVALPPSKQGETDSNKRQETGSAADISDSIPGSSQGSNRSLPWFIQEHGTELDFLRAEHNETLQKKWAKRRDELALYASMEHAESVNEKSKDHEMRYRIYMETKECSDTGLSATSGTGRLGARNIELDVKNHPKNPQGS